MTVDNMTLMVLLGALLFATGLFIIITKKNAIMMLLGIELMLNASNVNLVAFNRAHSHALDGQMLAIFVILVAVCETAIGLALILRVYQYYQSSVPENLNELKD
jgi:NADH:ubiquinone oxidoreductase subunit K